MRAGLPQEKSSVSSCRDYLLNSAPTLLQLVHICYVLKECFPAPFTFKKFQKVWYALNYSGFYSSLRDKYQGNDSILETGTDSANMVLNYQNAVINFQIQYHIWHFWAYFMIILVILII